MNKKSIISILVVAIIIIGLVAIFGGNGGVGGGKATTYENSEFGFSFEYPETFELGDEFTPAKPVVVSGVEYTIPAILNLGLNDPNLENENFYMLLINVPEIGFEGVSAESSDDVYIGGERAEMEVYENSEIQEDIIVHRFAHNNGGETDDVYYFVARIGQRDKDAREINERMLESFTFTETE